MGTENIFEHKVFYTMTTMLVTMKEDDDLLCMGMGNRFGCEDAGFGLEPKETMLPPCLKQPGEKPLRYELVSVSPDLVPDCLWWLPLARERWREKSRLIWPHLQTNYNS